MPCKLPVVENALQRRYIEYFSLIPVGFCRGSCAAVRTYPYTESRRVMSAKRGDKAFNGEWEKILVFVFEITEEMTIEF